MARPEAQTRYRHLVQHCTDHIPENTPVISRFAPSPTGYLHLGHIANACFVWGITHALGGRVILRMEDHDRERCRPEYEAAILEDLDWLGLEPDLGTLDTWQNGATIYRQSDCGSLYQAALDKLIAQGRAYACDCSRKSLSERRTPGGANLIYDGHCRGRELDFAQPDTSVRFCVTPDTVQFDDLLLGVQVQSPVEQCGDFPLYDRHGNWTYHLAVVVDDLAQGVNLIIRGEDLLDSTGRQEQLAIALGRETCPFIMHHPLIMDAGGRKLSKRDADTGIRELRAAGCSPESVLGKAAWACGLLDQDTPLHPEALPELFR